MTNVLCAPRSMPRGKFDERVHVCIAVVRSLHRVLYDFSCTKRYFVYLICIRDALRVLPCQHEFHLHCFDRWVYTFATETRADTEPSCPLCKASLTL
jgi:hypothetical protein